MKQDVKETIKKLFFRYTDITPNPLFSRKVLLDYKVTLKYLVIIYLIQPIFLFICGWNYIIEIYLRRLEIFAFLEWAFLAVFITWVFRYVLNNYLELVEVNDNEDNIFSISKIFENEDIYYEWKEKSIKYVLSLSSWESIFLLVLAILVGNIWNIENIFVNGLSGKAIIEFFYAKGVVFYPPWSIFVRFGEMLLMGFAMYFVSSGVLLLYKILNTVSRFKSLKNEFYITKLINIIESYNERNGRDYSLLNNILMRNISSAYLDFLNVSERFTKLFISIGIVIIAISVIFYLFAFIGNVVMMHIFNEEPYSIIEVLAVSIIFTIFGLIMAFYPSLFFKNILRKYKSQLRGSFQDMYERTLLLYMSASGDEKKRLGDQLYMIYKGFLYYEDIRDSPISLPQYIKIAVLSMSSVIISLVFELIG